jgi:hypothetical protein
MINNSPKVPADKSVQQIVRPAKELVLIAMCQYYFPPVDHHSFNNLYQTG